jgi:sulfate transport system ATP-binding protein/putative spermidine/putrescine transport system ATP-binding protein
MSLVEGLVRHYDGFELNIPRWEIPDRGITALWGPSGAGKTTVFRILIGLESCPGLRWNFQGVDLASVPAPERRLGVVFQGLELFPHMSGEENILFAARARHLPAGETATRLAALTQELQMQEFLKRPARVLSGGEAQRIALARAVIAQPRFLFLDEPFSSLDAELKAGARAMVLHLIERLAVPTLLISHDPEDLKALTTNVVRIAKGRLV